MTHPYKLRSGIVFFICCILFIIIAINLYIIQIYNSSFYTHLAAQQHHVNVSQFSPRADIYDRTGKQLLACNKECISAFLIPNELKDPETVKQFLKTHFPHAQEQLKKHKHKSFMYIKRKLTSEQVERIKQAHIPDIKLLTESTRYYPLSCASTVIGITDIDNKGLAGIELSCDAHLTGEPTTYSLDKDARSGCFYFNRETHASGNPPTPLYLTIDGDLQFLAYKELEQTLAKFNSHEGSVIIMDPKTGEILTMVSIPDFDPNQPAEFDVARTKNRVLTESYELGSVFKEFAALAALEEGLVTLDEEIDCKNAETCFIDGRRINTPHAAGIITFRDVIAHSNNIGIAIVAKRLQQKIYDHYTRMGFGKKTGLSFPGENPGFVNKPENWSKQSIISLSYGYEVSANILQVARAFSMIANGGYLLTPKLMFDGKKPAYPAKPLYSAASLDGIKQIMEHTTMHGSARRAQKKGYKIMCKTGTANILVNGEYNKEKNLYTCAGIVERDDYQRVIVTFVKEATGYNLFASMVAVPLFERVTEQMLIHDRII